MSQDAKEEQGLDPSDVGRRQEDIAAHIEGAEATSAQIGRRREDISEHVKGAEAIRAQILADLAGINSPDIDEAAKSVRAFYELQREIAQALSEPVDESQLLARTAELTKWVVEARGRLPTPVVAWNPEQRQGFLDKLVQENLIKPPSPIAPPAAGTTPPVGNG